MRKKDKEEERERKRKRGCKVMNLMLLMLASKGSTNMHPNRLSTFLFLSFFHIHLASINKHHQCVVDQPRCKGRKGRKDRVEG